MEKKSFADFNSDPAWQALGPYLYNPSQELLLISDKGGHLANHLMHIYGNELKSKTDFADITYDMIEEPESLQMSEQDFEDAQYEDNVQYSAEGFQVPPTRRVTAEDQLLQSMEAEGQLEVIDEIGRSKSTIDPKDNTSEEFDPDWPDDEFL